MDKQKPSMNDKSAIHHDYYNDLKTPKRTKKRTIKRNHFCSLQKAPKSHKKTFKSSSRDKKLAHLT